MKKVLIVEDDIFISEVMTTLLNGMGIVVEERENTKFLEEKTLTADVIILDLWIDDVDGRDVYKLIKKHPELSKSKVVIISAASNILSIADELDLPYIKKPFDIDDFTEKISKLLN